MCLKNNQRKIQQRRFVQGPFLQCRCPNRVKLDDVDVGTGGGGEDGEATRVDVENIFPL